MKKVLKTAAAVVLMLCMVFGSAVMAVPEKGFSFLLKSHAAEIIDSGALNENITWTLDEEGLLVVSGTGDMPTYDEWNWDEDDTINFSYDLRIKEVIIEDGITSIGDEAFFWCNQIVSISMPDSITKIGIDAFNGCIKLGSITIPENVTIIDSGAFYDCRILTSVIIPNSVTSIGGEAFVECTGLTAVTIGNGVTSIGNYAFQNCVCLTSIPDSITSFGEGAFYGCTGLTSINITNGVTDISGSVFYECTGLTSVTISDSVKSIGEAAFYGCTGLTTVNIPNSVTSIGNHAFYDCTGLTTVNIPNSVTSIGVGTFFGCTGLTSVTIPNSVTSIGVNAFEGCTELTSVTIPDSVTSISKGVFSGCTGMTSVTIPDSVTSIGDSAFSGCAGLTSITIPNSVTSIGKSAFSGCTGLTSITIPNSVTSIGESAFSGCTGMTSVTIPNSVTSIELGAFSRCTGLTSITIPNSVTSIGKSAFSGCTGLTSINIPNSITSIGAWAFERCTGLTSVTIPDSVTSIELGAFEGCTGLTSVTIPNSITSVVNYMFQRCTGLKSVIIPNSVRSIGYQAFYGCTGLTSVSIPENVKSIGQGAFEGCTGLTSITINNPSCSIADDSGTIYYQATIYGFKGSTAETYATKYNRTFVSLDDEPAAPFVNHGNFNYRSDFIPVGEENNNTYDHNLSYKYDYDENWFEKSAYVYQHDLTKMSIRMAMAAFGYGNDLSAKNISDLFTDLNFANIKTKYKTPNIDTIGYAIGSKKIKFNNGETYSLIAVGVRGGGYGNEWGGNFRVGYYGVHEGFQIAADQVLEGLESYVSEHREELGDNIKVWIAGYSRAAATTNLVAKELDLGRIDGITADNVYAFCFECPQNTVSENAHNELFNNIVSIVNPIDFVPYVAMSDWNFTRYGKTYYLPFKLGLGNKDYYPLKVNMVTVYQDILEKNRVSTDYGSSLLSTAPWTENLQQAEILNQFWNTFAKQMTSTVPYLPVGCNIANKLIIGGITYSTLEDIIREAEANGSTKERIYYTGFHQDSFIITTAGLLGGSGNKLDSYAALGSEILKIVPQYAITHPILTGETVYLFTSYRAPYGHYAELCLSWLDSLEGEVGYFDHPTYRRVLVNCPVNVTITDSEGVTVAEMIDDVPQEIEDGIYAYLDDDGQKVFILPDNDEYTINITGTDEGTVTYTVNEYNLDTNSNENVVSYYEIPIEVGDVLVGKVENLELTEGEYPLLKDNGEQLEPDINQSREEVVTHIITTEVVGNGVVGGAGEYTSGQYIRLIAVPDEDYIFSGWYNGEELVSTKTEYRMLIDNDYDFIARFEKVNFIVSPGVLSMLPGDYQTLTTNGLPDVDVVWISNNGDVATVDENGTVYAHAKGTAIITATTEDGRFTNCCIVTVGEMLILTSTTHAANTLSWTENPTAAYYDILRSEDGENFNIIASVSTEDGTGYIDDSLAYNTDYFYKVAAYAEDGTLIAESNVIDAVTALVTPALTAAPASYNSVKLTWYKVDGANGYEIYRSAGNEEPVLIKTVGGGAVKFTNTGLQCGTEYKYFIRAYKTVNKVKTYSADSNTAEATPIPATTAKLTAAPNTAAGTIKLTWSAVAGSNGYEVERAYSIGGDYESLGESPNGKPTITDQPEEIGHKYFYHVRAFRNTDNGKVYGNWSPSVSATLELLAPTVRLVSSTYNSAKIGWDKVTGTTGYEVWRSDDGGEFAMIADIKKGSTVVYNNTKLTPGVQYSYKVIAYYKSKTETNRSGDSNIVEVTPEIDAPKTFKVARSGNNLKVTWSAVGGASGYELYRSVNGKDFVLIAETTAKVKAYTDTNVNRGVQYSYKVRAIAPTATGRYSQVVTATPTLAAPGGFSAKATGCDTITLKWSKSAGATGYAVYRSKTKNGTYYRIGSTDGNTAVTYTDTGLDTGVTYYYVIKAMRKQGGTTGYSQCSAIKSAKTALKAPTKPASVKLNGNTARLSWTAAPGADGYVIYRKAPGSKTFEEYAETTDTTYDDTGLEAKKTYQYKVMAYRVNSDGERAYSPFTGVIKRAM